MNSEDRKNLAKVRYERAVELLKAANILLKENDFKSANNRAFYSSEQAIKAVLSIIEKSSETHNGILSIFNMEFIHKPSQYFSKEDMKMFRSMGRIREASDYDDFYIANKAECENQVAQAKHILEKVYIYLNDNGVFENE
ncbi:MAG: HEPN domain-containing protein [Lachnospiraceae bacterium]|nr:HEPN domain-containing protein [Lachnospiraceae bacterium]